MGFHFLFAVALDSITHPDNPKPPPMGEAFQGSPSGRAPAKRVRGRYFGQSRTPVPTRVIGCRTVANTPKPPLCKGRWHAKRDGGIVVGATCRKRRVVRDIGEMGDISGRDAASGRTSSPTRTSSSVGADSCRLRRSARDIKKEGGYFSGCRGRQPLPGLSLAVGGGAFDAPQYRRNKGYLQGKREVRFRERKTAKIHDKFTICRRVFPSAY